MRVVEVATYPIDVHQAKIDDHHEHVLLHVDGTQMNEHGRSRSDGASTRSLVERTDRVVVAGLPIKSSAARR